MADCKDFWIKTFGANQKKAKLESLFNRLHAFPAVIIALVLDYCSLFGKSSVELGYFAEMIAYHFEWYDQKLYDIITFCIPTDPYVNAPSYSPKYVKLDEVKCFVDRFGPWEDGKCFKTAIKNLIDSDGLIEPWWLAFADRDEALVVLQKGPLQGGAYGAIRYNDQKGGAVDTPFKLSYCKGDKAKHIFIKRIGEINYRYAPEKVTKDFETLNELLAGGVDVPLNPGPGKIHQTLQYYRNLELKDKKNHRFVVEEKGGEEVLVVPKDTPQDIASKLKLRFHYTKKHDFAYLASPPVPGPSPYSHTVGSLYSSTAGSHYSTALPGRDGKESTAYATTATLPTNYG